MMALPNDDYYRGPAQDVVEEGPARADAKNSSNESSEVMSAAMTLVVQPMVVARTLMQVRDGDCCCC